MEIQQTIDLYKTILEQQQDSYHTLFTILIALTTIFIGSSWLWNIFIVKQQVKGEVDKYKDELKKSFKDKETELINNINKEFTINLETKYKETFSAISNLYGNIAYDKGHYDIAIEWFFGSLKNSLYTNNGKIIRNSIDNINRILNNSSYTEYDENKFNIEIAKEIIQKVPDTLFLEINEILKKLSILKAKVL